MSSDSKHRRGDRYTLGEELGAGGFGRVYVAFDRVLNREVALKEIRPSLADRSENRQRLMREVQITSQLEHPGIVPVYDLAAESDDGSPFYTMRMIRGQNLKDAIAAHHERVARGAVDPLALPVLVNAVIGICNAIGFAHSRGVMHRDLKPDNVVLGEFGEVVLLDWGVAKVAGDRQELPAPPAVRVSEHADAHETAAGGAVGTPAYMAPEQARGVPGPRTDVYGLGAILYELLTGRPPHEGEDSAEVLERILSGPSPRARDRVAKVPPALDAICARAMARDPGARYADPAAVANELQRFLADEPVRAYREPMSGLAVRWMRRHRAWTVAAIAVVLVTALVTSIATVQLARHSRRERDARIAAEGMREQGLRVAAKFAARTVAREIDLRWRILEAEADSPVLVAALQALRAVDEVVAHPEREALQRWVEARHREYLETATATSWFVSDARGRHVGRSPLDERILGGDFAFRDYFHGQGRDLPPGTRGVTPLDGVHRSVVFESQATNNLIVAFSVPVWSSEDADRRVVGVLAMTVELGRFKALQLDLSDDQTAVLVETESDWVQGEERSGLILHHPQLGRGQVYRLDEDLVGRLRRLRVAELARGHVEIVDSPDAVLPARLPPLPGSLVHGYRDPLGTSAQKPWLAAFEPVLVMGRAAAQRDTGWVVLVQERAASVPD